eukprot:422070-Rhodomonas_salina.1
MVCARAAVTMARRAASSPASRWARSSLHPRTNLRTWHSRFTGSGTGASASPHRPFDAINRSDASAARKWPWSNCLISGRTVAAPSDASNPSGVG